MTTFAGKVAIAVDDAGMAAPVFPAACLPDDYRGPGQATNLKGDQKRSSAQLRGLAEYRVAPEARVPTDLSNRLDRRRLAAPDPAPVSAHA